MSGSIMLMDFLAKTGSIRSSCRFSSSNLDPFEIENISEQVGTSRIDDPK